MIVGLYSLSSSKNWSVKRLIGIPSSSILLMSFSGGLALKGLVKYTSFASKPASLIIVSSSWPLYPIKGRPPRSSSAPGASPIIHTGALGLPLIPTYLKPLAANAALSVASQDTFVDIPDKLKLLLGYSHFISVFLGSFWFIIYKLVL